MKYYEVKFCITAPDYLRQDACDVVMAMAGEAGFESFAQTGEGFNGYVQQSLLRTDLLEELMDGLPFDEVKVEWQVAEAEDRDWNEQWENEGFGPVVVGSGCVVHDGRHLDGIRLDDYGLAVEIDAHLAFGTGNHETTRLMIAALLQLQLGGCRVLDGGCGTGILGIVALKRGAKEVVGYDIDEWSVNNALHNAVINGVGDAYTALLGDAAVLGAVEGTFDVVMANINRNVLLADMPAFCSKLAPGGRLLLSGFYTDDRQLLVDMATGLGLRLDDEHVEDNWMCLVFSCPC